MKKLLKDAQELLKALEGHNLDAFELSAEEGTYRFAKGHIPGPPAPAAAPVPAEVQAVERASEAPPPPEAPAESHLVPITSPMVGMFYRATEPGRPPLVELGQTVTPGTPVCILEAMKLMNVIKADVEGVIARILVENATAVQSGQVLFLVDPGASGS